MICWHGGIGKPFTNNPHHTKFATFRMVFGRAHGRAGIHSSVRRPGSSVSKLAAQRKAREAAA